MFVWYARGGISLKVAARKAHAAGLLYPKSGAKVPVSTVHTILRNRPTAQPQAWQAIRPEKAKSCLPRLAFLAKRPSSTPCTRSHSSTETSGSCLP